MRHLALAALSGATLAVPLAAQLPPISLDFSAGATGGAQRAAASAWYPVVNLVGRLHLGVGARVSAYAGDPANYINRGAVQGSLASTVAIDPAVYAVNGAVFGELDLIGSLAAGANLDLVGLATGPRRTSGSLTQKPEAGSYFGYGSGDRGALNSEFFISVQVAPRARLRAGASHYVTAYTVTDTAAAGSPSSRYQKFETVPFVAFRLRL